MNNIRTIEEYKEDVFDKLDEQQKLEWLYEMSSQINRAIEYIENNKQYVELEDYGKNGEYYIDEIGLLEILGSDKE